MAQPVVTIGWTVPLIFVFTCGKHSAQVILQLNKDVVAFS